MKIKKVIAIVLVGVGMLSAGAAETRAEPLLVNQGFFQTFEFFNLGTFSGANFSVSDISTGGGSFGAQVFTTGILQAGFGIAPNPGTGTIQVGNVSCQMIPAFDPNLPVCGGVMTFINPPIPIGPPNLPDGSFAATAPFTMTGQLTLGPNLTVDIVGSGILHALDSTQFAQSNARYEFTVPEPSSAWLLFTGVSALLVARRRRRSVGLGDRGTL
jgi:hypothetical protein